MNYRRLFISLILPQLAGFIGSIFMIGRLNDWFYALHKPIFYPPEWLFGPVWITLYILMGLASYLVWQRNTRSALKTNQIYWIHLIFNALWTILFFYFQSISLALVDIIILWCLILALIFLFNRENKISAILIIPYFLWVSFATLLNLSILILN